MPSLIAWLGGHAHSPGSILAAPCGSSPRFIFPMNASTAAVTADSPARIQFCALLFRSAKWSRKRRILPFRLFGLAPWREEATALAAHLEYLLKRCWKSSLTVSVPRLRPAAGEFRPHFPMSDRDLVHLVCALRVTFPQVGIVLSTREPAALRDLLVKIGITMMSAGSHTEPGGYTGQGREKVHRTVRGRIMPPEISPSEPEVGSRQC